MIAFAGCSGPCSAELERQILSENLKGAEDKPKYYLSLILYNKCDC